LVFFIASLPLKTAFLKKSGDQTCLVSRHIGTGKQQILQGKTGLTHQIRRCVL
jgi:hypothetical protein